MASAYLCGALAVEQDHLSVPLGRTAYHHRSWSAAQSSHGTQDRTRLRCIGRHGVCTLIASSVSDVNCSLLTVI
jgi:hypothetical protein